MKLNEHSKNELRKEIEEAVKRVPEGQRIELPLDLLDDLIFLKIKDKKGVTVKFPIWTGEFLRKIDLSEISFENVYMGFINSDFVKNFDIDVFKLCDEYSIPFIYPRNDEIGRFYDIDFSFTNIQLDFSKFYAPLYMINVNFEGVDLSNSNLHLLKYLDNCNFSNTKLTLLPKIDDILGCDFSNNDLSNVEFDLTCCIENGMPNGFTNTGAKLKCDLEDLNKFNLYDLDLFISYGSFDGCYLNGDLVDNKKRKNMWLL